MTDYFCFPKVEPWNEDKVLLSEGFVYYRTPCPSDRIYSTDPVEQIALQKKHSFVNLYTRLDGLEVQQAIIADYAMQISSLPLWEEVLPNLHTLAFSRASYSQHEADKMYLFKKHPIKRLYVEDIFFRMDRISSPIIEREMQFINRIMAMEVDELWITGDITYITDSDIEALQRCKAKSLRITNVSLSKRVGMEKICSKLIELKNLSAIMFDASHSSVSFTITIDEIELLRSPQLGFVYLWGRHHQCSDKCKIHGEYKVYGKCEDISLHDRKLHSICTSKILNKRLHSVLVNVCIALHGIEFSLYGAYFILEYLPEMRGHKRFAVIHSLEKIRESISKVKQRSKVKAIKL